MFQSEVLSTWLEIANVLDCCFGRDPFLDVDQTRRYVSNCGLFEPGIEAAACFGSWGRPCLGLDTTSQQGMKYEFR